jgi:hypothetical protein
MVTATAPTTTENTGVIPEFRPTLIIGLGGTGHEVLVRLKAKLLDTFGEDAFKVVKLLSFDTADEPLQATTSRGEQVRLGRNTELVSISNVPVADLITHIDRHPTIKNWIPKNLPVTSINAGARMVRPLGRVALFHHYNVIKAQLQKAIEQLRNISIVGRLGSVSASESQVMNVFVICSLSGGTGSGTFIDMAYMARKICENNGVKDVYLNGMLVLPEAFAAVRDDRIRVNAYAALRELDHFMTNGGFSVEYIRSETVDLENKPPFNICYLIDAINEDGRRLSGIPEIAPMLAESILLQIGSQVGKANDSRFDNVDVLGKDDGLGNMRHYSGVGLASISFPAKQIISVCANRLGSELIGKEFLAQRANEEQAGSLLRDFIASNQLERDPLLLELSRNPSNRQALTVQLQEGMLANVKAEELLTHIQAYISKVENQDLNTGYKLALDSNRKQLTKYLSAAIEGALTRILNDSELGVLAANDFISNLGRHIEGLTNVLNQEIKGATDRHTTLTRQVAPSWQALSEATQSFALGRAGRINDARQTYFQLRQQQFHVQFDINKRNVAIALLADLGVLLSEQKRRVNTLQDKLSITKSQFESAIADTAIARDRYNSPLSYDITTPNDVTAYYSEMVRDLRENRTQIVEQSGGLASWLDKEQADINRIILDYGLGVFEPIRSKRIEDVIITKQRERSPQDRLQDLRRDSVPFWNYNRALLSGGGSDMTQIVSIGVENKDSSIFRDENLQGEEITSTYDPHGVTVLNTKHGLPLSALQQYDQYRQKYKVHIGGKGASPVQLFSYIDISDDQGEREARQFFALGEAFGFITSTGANMYYCKRSDELSPPAKLGQGLETSVQNFALQPEFVQEVQKMIEKRMDDIGRQEAIKTISTYATPGAPAANPTPRELASIELKKLARDYVDLLRK